MRRLAWFSPLPPVRSGVSTYTADVIPLLREVHTIDVFDEPRAHEFVWRHANAPYDLIVYQVGNSLYHEYVWPYLTRYPGLVVLHDAQLHHSRALMLLRRQRGEAYRDELFYSHPTAPADLDVLFATGLGGSLYFLWPMLRLAISRARLVAVHESWLAEELAQRDPTARVEWLRMGVADHPSRRKDTDVRGRHQIPGGATVFACYGKVTPEKRISQILHALRAVARRDRSVHLLLVGETSLEYDVLNEARALGVEDRVTVAGFVADEDLPSYIDAADVCLCLRWPTSRETSASWLRCLAAGKPTVVTNLEQMRDVLMLDPHMSRVGGDGVSDQSGAVCMGVDILDEEQGLELAMGRLATDAALRVRLGTRAREWWSDRHTVRQMRDDYLRVIEAAIDAPPPGPSDLPRHVLDDGTRLARRIALQVGIALDFLDPRSPVPNP